MGSKHSDAGQERWLADRGIDLLRRTGRLAGTGVVEVDGVSDTAEHIVVATGADPFVPPIPGLRDLKGVWGTREATSIQPSPSFSGIYDTAVMDLRMAIAGMPPPAKPIDAQMARMPA